MKHRRIIYFLPVAVVGLCAVAFLGLGRANARLAQAIADARSRNATLRRQRDQNQQLAILVRKSSVDAPSSHREIDAIIADARNQVVALENEAIERGIRAGADLRLKTEALRTNRDPTKGPVLIENCANVGQATPADAVQTLVWAAMRGDEAAVEHLIAMDSAARDQLQTALAELPDSARSMYPTPERLAALWISDLATRAAAIDVVRQTPIDGQHIILSLGRLDGQTQDALMVLNPGGWQIGIDDRGARKIVRQLLGAVPKS